MDERSRIRERTGTQDAARADTRAADAAGVCPHCGAPLERDDYEFCPVCGGKWATCTRTQVVSEGTKGAVMYTEDVEKKVYKRV